jgi:CheY-like chemotaxis protein
LDRISLRPSLPGREDQVQRAGNPENVGLEAIEAAAPVIQNQSGGCGVSIAEIEPLYLSTPVSTESDAVKHILIVDDDVFYRKLVLWILEDAGFRVTAAEDFSAVIKVLEADQHVHMLLADVQMPVGTPNGVTISRMARLRRHKLPIVYMTGFYDPAKLQAVEPDIAVLSKPFTGQDLLRIVEAALNPAGTILDAGKPWPRSTT